MRFVSFLLLVALMMAQVGTEKSNRLPIPDAAAQASAEKTIRQIFKDGYAKTKPADQAELGSALFDLAEKTKDDPTSRYVLLRQAIDMAARGGNLAAATKAIDELVELQEGRHRVKHGAQRVCAHRGVDFVGGIRLQLGRRDEHGRASVLCERGHPLHVA